MLALVARGEAVFRSDSLISNHPSNAKANGTTEAIFRSTCPKLCPPAKPADALGPAELLRRVRALEERHGKRFAPPELLVERARTGRLFYS